VLIIAAVLLVIGLCLHLLSAGRVYSFKAKHVLITGGSSGIGKEIAIEALKRGADHVTLVARNKEKLQSTKSELDGLLNNQTVNVISLNVGDSDAGEQLKELLKDLPPVDILVNSAGITYTALFSQTSQETFQVKPICHNLMVILSSCESRGCLRLML
jgi:short-subunit dehydrogenase